MVERLSGSQRMTNLLSDSRKTGKSFIGAGTVLLVVVLTVTAYLWYGHHGPFAEKVVPPEKLTIAVATLPMSAPIYVALDRGYFRKEGLDISVKSFTSGKDALATALSGSADLATVAETPVMLAVMEGSALALIATISESEKNTGLVVRKDRGILQPADLKGKTIGVTPATNGEYFLDTFLIFHGIQQNDTRIVPLKPEEMEQTLAEGRVDAVATWEPHISQTQKQLGDKAQTYHAAGIYRMTWNIVSRPDLIKRRPQVIKKALWALLSAERFIVEQPGEALQITANHLGVAQEALSAPWGACFFKVTLDQALLVNLESQARWAIRNRLVTGTEVPNFLSSIHRDTLKAVRPDAVTLGD